MDTIPPQEKLTALEQTWPAGTRIAFEDAPMLALFGLYKGDPHTFKKVSSTEGKLIAAKDHCCLKFTLNQPFSFGSRKEIVLR